MLFINCYTNLTGDTTPKKINHSDGMVAPTKLVVCAKSSELYYRKYYDLDISKIFWKGVINLESAIQTSHSNMDFKVYMIVTGTENMLYTAERFSCYYK